VSIMLSDDPHSQFNQLTHPWGQWITVTEFILVLLQTMINSIVTELGIFDLKTKFWLGGNSRWESDLSRVFFHDLPVVGEQLMDQRALITRNLVMTLSVSVEGSASRCSRSSWRDIPGF
jgi:hypothetical protein